MHRAHAPLPVKPAGHARMPPGHLNQASELHYRGVTTPHPLAFTGGVTTLEGLGAVRKSRLQAITACCSAFLYKIPHLARVEFR